MRPVNIKTSLDAVAINVMRKKRNKVEEENVETCSRSVAWTENCRPTRGTLEISEQKSGIAKFNLTLTDNPLPYGCG